MVDLAKSLSSFYLGAFGDVHATEVAIYGKIIAVTHNNVGVIALTEKIVVTSPSKTAWSLSSSTSLDIDTVILYLHVT